MLRANLNILEDRNELLRPQTLFQHNPHVTEKVGWAMQPIRGHDVRSECLKVAKATSYGDRDVGEKLQTQYIGTEA